ncbi:MAG: DUF4011 domain-containing protein, partial [Myxococcales bacterium]|nr:DUF4011 domain-containing protein [Myxococcales bacterium]
MPSTDPIIDALEAARAELLDPGLRNPLVRFRPSSRHGVEIVDERSAEVFRILVAEGRDMDFLPAPDADSAASALAQPEVDGRPAARHVDRHLQTPHATANLQRRLLDTAQQARTLVEEQGVNVCALALGMLHWPDGDQTHRAPLLLIPAVLERTNAQCRFTVRADDDPHGNPSLAVMLRSVHGFELPLPGDDLDAATYVAEVEKAVGARPGWRVVRDEMALGLFDFGRLLLYHDLDPAAWPAGGAPAQHPVVRALLGEGFPGDEAGATAPLVVT